MSPSAFVMPGKPLPRCPACEGRGWIHVTWMGALIGTQACAVCGGAGVPWPLSEHRKART